MTTTLPELMTINEVADYLRVNPETVRRWTKHGTLDAVHLPCGYRIKKATIEAILDGEQKAS